MLLKRAVSCILFMLLFIDTVCASANYVYSSPDQTVSYGGASNVIIVPENYDKYPRVDCFEKSSVDNTSDKVVLEDGDRFISEVEITPESYKGSVKTVEHKAPVQSMVNNQKEDVEEEKTFSEKHPVLTALFVGAVVVGSVAVIALANSNSSSEDRYDDRHRPPHDGKNPPPPHHHHKKY